MYVNGLTGHHFYCCQRPTAKELLRHHFIRRAKRTAHLGELIDRHQRWKANHPQDGASSGSDDDLP